MAPNHALVRACRCPRRHSAGFALFPCGPRSNTAGRFLSGRPEKSPRFWSAAQRGFRDDVCCLSPVLYPRGNPQGHLIAFCGDLGISRSVGALMLSLLFGTAFGNSGDWSPIVSAAQYCVDGIGLADFNDDSLPAHAKRSRSVHDRGRIWAWLVGHYSGLCLGRSRTISLVGCVLENSNLAAFSGGGMGAGGWIVGLLYGHFGYYLPAFAAGLGTNALNLLVMSVLVVRQRPKPA